MNPTVMAVRAVTTAYARTILQPLLLVGIGIYGAILVLIWWIASMSSAWWWLLAVVPTAIFLVALLLWMMAYMLSKRLAPPMNKEQRKLTRRFVSRVGKAAEHLGTPRFVLIFRVLKDLVIPPRNGQTFIGEITELPGGLRQDFEELRRSFEG